jgi:hypothetical protein
MPIAGQKSARVDGDDRKKGIPFELKVVTA